MRTAVVIGTGLIGTSAALALTARGITVHLADHDPDRARTAAALGAGTDEPRRSRSTSRSSPYRRPTWPRPWPTS